MFQKLGTNIEKTIKWNIVGDNRENNAIREQPIATSCKSDNSLEE